MGPPITAPSLNAISAYDRFYKNTLLSDRGETSIAIWKSNTESSPSLLPQCMIKREDAPGGSTPLVMFIKSWHACFNPIYQVNNVLIGILARKLPTSLNQLFFTLLYVLLLYLHNCILYLNTFYTFNKNLNRFFMSVHKWIFTDLDHF